MPYANNQGVRIHYQVTGDGLPLVLQHGFSNSLEDWDEFGYVEMLSRDHRLILVDARGHCASELTNATFLSLPNLDHIRSFWRSDLVVPHVIEFLASL